MNSVNIQQWEAQQTKAFKNWANYWLKQSGYTERKLDNVMVDVADGVILINLFKALSGEEIPRYVKNPSLTAQKIENLSIALNAFKEYGIVANVSPEDFLEGKEKFILGYLWRLIQKFQVIHSTRSGGAPSNAKSIRDVVLEWVKEYTEDYPVKEDINASSPGCFADGMLLSYMIHKTDPGLIDLKEMEKKSRKQRIETAFELASKLGVPEVIDASDLLKDNIEEKVLLVYLTSFKTAAENYKQNNPGTTKASASKGPSSTSAKGADGSKGSSSAASALANSKPGSSNSSAKDAGKAGPGSSSASNAGSGSGVKGGPGSTSTGSTGSSSKAPGSGPGTGSGNNSGSGSGVKGGPGSTSASGAGSGSGVKGGPGSTSAGSAGSGSGVKGSPGSASGAGSGSKGPSKSTGPGVWDSVATKEQEKIICPICEKHLNGRIVCVKTLDNNEYLYHTDCWICSQCRKELLSLGLDFYLLESHPYCAECYHRAIDRVCAKCGKIAKESPVKALGKVWHSTCFVCQKCGCSFTQSRNFYNHNGTPYCEKHFQEVEMEENICAHCGKGISGDIINALGKKWHDPECWVCRVCSKPLEGKFFQVDGFPRCESCCKK